MIKFEHSNQSFIYLISLSSLILMFALSFALRSFVNILGIWTSFLLSIGLPIALFLLLKKKAKLHGSAVLEDQMVKLYIKKDVLSIQFNQIEKIIINESSRAGIYLKIRLLDGKKMKISANVNFCNPEPFEKFLDKLIKKTEQYKKLNKAELIIKKNTSGEMLFPTTIIGYIGGVILYYSLNFNSETIIPLLYVHIVTIALFIYYFYQSYKKERK